MEAGQNGFSNKMVILIKVAGLEGRALTHLQNLNNGVQGRVKRYEKAEEMAEMLVEQV